MCLKLSKPISRTIGPRLLLCLVLLAVFSLWSVSLFAEENQDNALFWRISLGDSEAGYLLGTIHSEDPRVLDFTEDFIAQLTSCPVFAMEMVPDLPTLTRLTEFMHYKDAVTLRNTLGVERFDRVMEALSSYQVPIDWKVKMKVWAVMMTLSVPSPETGFFMDLSLSLRAAGAGMKVTGLETLEQQLSFLEDMPLEHQMVLLDQALDEYQRVEEIHLEMINIYLDEGLTGLSQMSDDQFDQLDPEIRNYFTGLGIDARNQRMLENLLPLLEASKVFVAVGALHLPGEQGLLALLRAQGYTLHPLALPFLGSG
jgi:uncharacterized protein YbaP (TraB family)